MPTSGQLGIAEESTYATGVTPTRFFEYEVDGDGVSGQYGRVAVRTKRAGQRVARSDRFMPYAMGATGPIRLPVLTKGHGIWLKHALGTIATAGPTDGNYTHTASVGPINGKSLTAQFDRQFTSGTSQPWTYEGVKITKATWRMSRQGALTAVYETDAAEELTATALAVPSYPTGPDIMTWVGTTITVNGVQKEIYEWEVSITNPLKTDRYGMRGNVAKKEPVEQGDRTIAWSFVTDYDSLADFNRVASASVAGSLTAVVFTVVGPVAHSGTTLPQFQLSIPVARFDGVSDLTSSGDDPIEPSFSGVGLDAGMTIAYRTTDVTP